MFAAVLWNVGSALRGDLPQGQKKDARTIHVLFSIFDGLHVHEL